MNEFEELIINDDSLSKLLNEKTVTAFSNFHRKRHSDAFKVYIEERYLETFFEIYERLKQSSEVSQRTALIRSIRPLATEKSKEKIITVLLPYLETAYEKFSVFKESLEADGEYITITTRLEQPIDSLAIRIYNDFESDERVIAARNKMVATALDLCDSLADANPKRHPFKFEVYNIVMNNLKEIDDLGPHAARYADEDKRINSKRNKAEIRYWVVGGIIALLLLMRLLSRLG